jgi:hypothetical protein
MHVFLRRSKTDQLAAGRTIDVSRRASSLECPVAALRAWLDHAEIHDGPIFRAVSQVGVIGMERLKGRTVANVVKKHGGRRRAARCPVRLESRYVPRPRAAGVDRAARRRRAVCAPVRRAQPPFAGR